MTDTGEVLDLLVIGGGINGASIARAASIAGQRVALVEQGDLAQATSSSSTKLMHGGLRYLERYEFKLVAESLNERAIMLRTAPHLVRPLEFRLPHMASMRPWPIVRIGLLLYDWLARHGSLPRSRGIRLTDAAFRQSGIRAFSYWDAWVDDARLVVANALDAAEHGADIRTQTKLILAERRSDIWNATVQGRSGRTMISARMIVNASGPWVQQVLQNRLCVASKNHMRLVRGSHIVVPRCFAGAHALLLQQPDGRAVFAIPYLDDYTLIGTTDTPTEKPEDSRISDDEVAYLLAAVNLYRRESLSPNDIVGHYSGIRPLMDDGTDLASAVTRDYRLEIDRTGAPLLSVFGGKITTARHLAADALKLLNIAEQDTSVRPLPGGEFDDFATFLGEVRLRWPFLEPATLKRLARAYGTRIDEVLGNAVRADDLGQEFGAGLWQCEVDYLMRREWATSSDDILWRRTKLGYRLSPDQIAVLERYIERRT